MARHGDSGAHGGRLCRLPHPATTLYPELALGIQTAAPGPPYQQQCRGETTGAAAMTRVPIKQILGGVLCSVVGLAAAPAAAADVIQAGLLGAANAPSWPWYIG